MSSSHWNLIKIHIYICIYWSFVTYRYFWYIKKFLYKEIFCIFTKYYTVFFRSCQSALSMVVFSTGKATDSWISKGKGKFFRPFFTLIVFMTECFVPMYIFYMYFLIFRPIFNVNECHPQIEITMKCTYNVHITCTLMKNHVINFILNTKYKMDDCLQQM